MLRLLCSTFLLLTGLIPVVRAQDFNPVVATVDGGPVHLDEFALWLVRQRAEAGVKGLLADHVLEREAQRLGVTVEEQEIAATLETEIDERVEGAFGGDLERWRAELASLGTTEAAHRARRREELRSSLQAARILAGERTVDGEELRELFEVRYGPDGRALWLRTIRLRMTLPAQASTNLRNRQQQNQELREALVARLGALRERILAGEDFAQLAREFSEDPSAERGGELEGPFSGEGWPGSFVDTIRTLTAGSISEPVYGRGMFGIYQIVREEQTNFEEVRDDLAQELLERPPSALEFQLLLGRLLEETEVEYLAELRRPAGDPTEVVLRLDGEREVTRVELGRWIARRQGSSYLESFVQELLLRRTAEAVGIGFDPERARARSEAELQQVIDGSFRGSREAWAADLERRGQDPSTLLDERSVRAEVDLVVEELVQRRRTVDDEAVRRLWEERYGPAGRGLEVRLIRRAVQLDESAREASQEELDRLTREAVAAAVAELEAVAARCRAGEDFATLAAMHSDDETRTQGGRVAGRFPLQRWPQAVQQALLDLEPGQLSEVMHLEPLVFLFQLVAITEVPFTEVEEELRKELLSRVPSVPERATFLNELLGAHTWTLHAERIWSQE